METSRARVFRRPTPKRAWDAAGMEMPSSFSKQPIRRALLVGSDQAALRVCHDVLGGLGFSIDTVASGIEAVIAARDGQPDVIVMDGQLRDVRGSEAIGWLRSNSALQTTPIIALVAKGEENPGVTRPTTMVRKPLSAAAVHRAVQEALD